LGLLGFIQFAILPVCQTLAGQHLLYAPFDKSLAHLIDGDNTGVQGLSHLGGSPAVTTCTDLFKQRLGRVDELPDHNPDGRQVNKGQQGATERVIPGGNTPAWLELMEKPLHFLA
jgi:hypothetical protein